MDARDFLLLCSPRTKYWLLLVGYWLFRCAAQSAAEVRPPERVTLQLKWTHAFQFAGYYAALEKGYYREAGLDVKIVEATPGVDPIRSVIEGHAQFGVGTSSLLLERNAGKPVVALAVIFQHSPYVLIARYENATQGIHDLIGKRIMLEPQSDEIMAYLKAEGIPLERITRVEHSYDVQDLISGRVDALAGYVINQPYDLDRARFQYQMYTPRSAGIDFYGDNLFTTEQELRAHPARVQAFRAASLRGWQYAMEHPEEIVDVILARYSQRHTREYHLFEARQMLPLLRPELIEIGYMYPGRWRHIANTYAEIGMLKPDFDLTGFLYDPHPPPPDLRWLYLFIGVATVVLTCVSALAVYIYRINARLRREAAERTRVEEALRESAERYRSILNASPDAIFITDVKDGRHRMVSPGAVKMFGFDREEELLGHVLTDLFVPEDHARATANVARVLQGNGPGPQEYCGLRVDGSSFDFEVNGEIIRDAAGQPIQMVSIARDISARKRAEQAAKRAQVLGDIIIDSIPGAFYVLDEHGRYTRWNAYQRDEIVGMPEDLMAGTNATDTIHPDDRALIRSKIANVLGSGMQETVEGRVLMRGGPACRWLLMTGRQMTIEGRPFLVGIGIDITERKQAEEALRASEEKYRGLFDESIAAVYVFDNQKNFINTNQAGVHLLGYARAELLHLRISDVDADPAVVLPAHQQLFSGQRLINYEHRLRRKDGAIITVLNNSRPLTDREGTIVGMLSTLIDITERKRAAADLQKMQKLQSVGTLAGGIAHDFNNIMMGLFGNVSMAKDELGKDHPGYASLAEAEKSMSRAVRLTQQLLTFAKGGDPVKADVSLGALVEEVAHFDLSGSPVKLVYQQAEDLWLADVDQGQIQQVVSNLTINARQAMPEGGHLYITLENAAIPAADITGLPPGKYVRVCVRDEGTGIEPKHLDRIFDPYFTTKQTGSGLGLATAYSIIKRHGGHIGVVSALGQGTTFTLYLPASASPPQAETTPSAAACPSPARPANILVMDDEKMIRDIVTKMLLRCGFSVATAPGGREAIAMYQQARAAGAPFDVVIMDLTIPGGIGGKEAIKDILALDPQARVIVSSGYADDPVMANYADYGFKGVAAKPYTLGNLQKVLRQALQQ